MTDKQKAIKHRIEMIESHAFLLNHVYNSYNEINEATIYNLLHDIRDLMRILFEGI